MQVKCKIVALDIGKRWKEVNFLLVKYIRNKSLIEFEVFTNMYLIFNE